MMSILAGFNLRKLKENREREKLIKKRDKREGKEMRHQNGELYISKTAKGAQNPPNK